MRGIFKFGVLAVVLAVGGQAFADTVINATWTGITPGDTGGAVGVNDPVTGLDGQHYQYGVNNFTLNSVVSGSTGIPNPYKAFCIEFQNLSPVTANWTIRDPSAAPDPGLNTDGNNSGAMGIQKANLLRELFKADFGLIGTSSANAQAFQFAVWEIVYDSDLDLTGAGTQGIHSFYIDNYSSYGAGSAPVIAQTWLNALDPTGNGPKESHLVALTNGNNQDFVTVDLQYIPSVPLPGTASGCMLLLGVAGVVRTVRKRS